MNLTTHLLLLPSLRIRDAILPLHHMPQWRTYKKFHVYKNCKFIAKFSGPNAEHTMLYSGMTRTSAVVGWHSTRVIWYVTRVRFTESEYSLWAGIRQFVVPSPLERVLCLLHRTLTQCSAHPETSIMAMKIVF